MLAHVNNTQLWYDTLGSGPPLMLLHGGPGLDHTEFRPWVEPLADHFTLIFVDERGTGRSERVAPETATTANMVEDIEALRQHLGYDRLALLGFSFGGFLALSYAAKYQAHLSHLLLVDTAPSNAFIPESEELVRAFASPDIKEALDNEGSITSDEEFRRVMEIEGPVYYKAWTSREQAMSARMNRDMIFGFEVSTWWGNNEMAQYDMRPFLPQITVPTLVVVGRYDRITPVSQAEVMAQAIPGARLEIFEDSGHMTISEEQDRFNALVQEFLGTTERKHHA
ncbi:MAG: alpha/beta fold hydrolase [Herpetosiphonaceae bacterium]|nr:alpha/beta fold hydrolase [Herpetosiphonaceae bacterium]